MVGGFARNQQIVVCADIFIGIANGMSTSGPLQVIAAMGAASAVGAFLGTTWSASLARLTVGAREPGYVVLLTSLGLWTLLASLVGVARGPGLLLLDDRAFEWMRLALPSVPAAPLVALALLALAFFAALLWASSAEGLKVSLLLQDRSFAEEIGVDARRLATRSGFVWGAIVGLVGCANAILAGNSPESGMPLFVFGACAALVSQSGRITRSLASGALIGAALVASQFVVSPSWSEPIIFMIIFIWIVGRGSGRSTTATR